MGLFLELQHGGSYFSPNTASKKSPIGSKRFAVQGELRMATLDAIVAEVLGFNI